MDYLITKDRGVLYDLFMLTTLPFSRCILIGTVFCGLSYDLCIYFLCSYAIGTYSVVFDFQV